MRSSKIWGYRIARQAWQNPYSGCDEVEIYYESGDTGQEHLHPSTHWWNQERFKDAKTLPARTP